MTSAKSTKSDWQPSQMQARRHRAGRGPRLRDAVPFSLTLLLAACGSGLNGASPLPNQIPATSVPRTNSTAPTLPTPSAPIAPWTASPVPQSADLGSVVRMWSSQDPGGPWAGCDLYAVTQPLTDQFRRVLRRTPGSHRLRRVPGSQLRGGSCLASFRSAGP